MGTVVKLHYFKYQQKHVPVMLANLEPNLGATTGEVRGGLYVR
jgi:hypothetical protein